MGGGWGRGSGDGEKVSGDGKSHGRVVVSEQ